MNYMQLLTALVIGSGAVIFGCGGTAPGGSGSQLASFAVTPSADLKVGKDYDQIQVKTQVQNKDKTYGDWTLAKAWAGLSETNKTASLEDPVKVTPGSYRINVIYLMGKDTTASASDTDPACPIKTVVLIGGKNTNADVIACRGGKEPDPKSKPKDPDTDNASITIKSIIVNSTGSTTDNSSGSTTANTKGTAALTATPQALDYPNCPKDASPSSAANPLWSWIVDTTLCASGTASKTQIDQKLGGCSCRLLAAQ